MKTLITLLLLMTQFLSAQTYNYKKVFIESMGSQELVRMKGTITLEETSITIVGGGQTAKLPIIRKSNNVYYVDGTNLGDYEIRITYSDMLDKKSFIYEAKDNFTMRVSRMVYLID